MITPFELYGYAQKYGREFLLPPKDRVGVWYADESSAWEGAYPMSMSTALPIKIMEYTAENGSSIADHRVNLPTEITIEFLLNPDIYKITLARMVEDRNRKAPFIVKTNAISYHDMFICDMAHNEAAETCEKQSVSVKFRMLKFVQAQYGTLDPKKVSTAKQEVNKPKVQKGTKAPIVEKTEADKAIVNGKKDTILSELGTTASEGIKKGYEMTPPQAKKYLNYTLDFYKSIVAVP